MRHRFQLLGGLAACCLMFAVAVPSYAQRRWSDNWQSERVNISRLIARAESRSSEFVQVFDQALDESELNGTLREGRLNDRARDIESELNMVRDAFDRADRYEVTMHLSRAINAASRINNVMNNRRMDYETEQQWNMLRSDLNRLAAFFDVRQLS